MNDVVLAPSPHLRTPHTVEWAMYGVVMALLPGIAVGLYYFGLNALIVILLSVAGCLLFEGLALKMRGNDLSPLRDGSAILTGLLLAMNLPANCPWFVVLVGCAVAIGLGKHVYGGLGHNPFNPALVARVFLLISFPVAMTTWPAPTPLSLSLDAVSQATPLGEMKTSLLLKGDIGAAATMNLFDPFLGKVGGSLGEVSALALLLGGLYLIARGIITWHIPAAFLTTVVVMTGAFWLYDPARYASPSFHLVTGGIMLGAFFMATDYVTSPVTGRGMLIFGVGCGILTVLIRLFGGYPEGVSFAILLMNGATPLIDTHTKPRLFGTVKGKKREASA